MIGKRTVHIRFRHPIVAVLCLALGTFLLVGLSASGLGGGPVPAFASDHAIRLGAPGVITLNVPKSVVPALVDGRCDDTSYAGAAADVLTDRGGAPGAAVRLFHTGLDLYVCIDIPAGTATGGQVAVRVDSDHSRSQVAMAGDYQFIATKAGGKSVAQGNGQGGFAPFTIPAGDFAAAAMSGAGGAWTAELRISLEWFGGYSRIDGLNLSLETSGGALLQGWPGTASVVSPAGWGDIVLGPTYRDTLTSGSVFLDGQNGYLVVPYAPELSPREITVEAWVKIVDGDCGTLVGNGRNSSYWLAFCQMIQFGHDAADSVDVGQKALGEGWHHVAVTMDADGLRTFYLDGAVDTLVGWEPQQEPDPKATPEPPEKLGVSDRMLRIGSDRDAPPDLNYLHAYVSELRIWNLPRTAQQIHDSAFQRLGGTEPGLIALYPFAGSLSDIAGHHDAGLMGSAALAREARDVANFVPTPTPPPYTYPKPAPIPAWDGKLGVSQGTVTLDGMCRPAEYRDATKLILEPDHQISMRLALTHNGLFLCTNILWGGHGQPGAVTLWFDRSGQGGNAPGPADLRLRLLPDGSLTANTGDGTGYGGSAPAVFTSKIISDTRFAPQEDISPINSPWWATEVEIPLDVLAPFHPGQPLHFAIRYEGSVVAGALSLDSASTTVVESWPAQFDPQRPSTWGPASTVELPIYLPWAAFNGRPAQPAATVEAASTSPESDIITISPERAAELQAQSAASPQAPAGWPRTPPTSADFDSYCPGGVLKINYAFNSELKWPRVDPSFGIVQSEGTLTEFDISPEDSPFIHDTHDMDMKMSVSEADRWKVLNGNASQGQVLETESGYFDQRALPMVGDHVTAKGRWIFDCGHAGKTEIHPLPEFESDRLMTVPDGIGTPGKQMQVRVANIRMTSHPGAFEYNLNNLGPFVFNLSLPPAPFGAGKLLFIRVLQGQVNKVAVTGLTATSMEVTLTPPGVTGSYYWQLMVGYLDQPKSNPSAANMQYTVHLDKIQVLDDLDSGAPDCHGFHDCGEWTMYIGVNGDWHKIFDRTTVYDGDPPYPLNVTIPAIGGDLHLHVTGYEDDDPFAGDIIQGGDWNLGPLSARCCGQNVWQEGPWKLWLTVSAGGDTLTGLPMTDSIFWLLRLANEPNDPLRYDLGTVPVPATGAPPAKKEQNSYIDKWPFQKSLVYIMTNDVDLYKFTLADFANVTFGPLPSGVQLQVEQTFPWNYSGSLPPNLQNLLGYQSAWLKVSSNAQAVTDQFYTLQINTTARTLPPDWGEPQDVVDAQGKGGRLVDLVTPDPAAEVHDYTLPLYQSRYLQKDWAWQHVKGDVDYYDVWIPPVKARPRDYPACEFNIEGALMISAYGMNLTVPATGASDVDSLTLTNLNVQFPGRHVYVQVRHPSGQRGFYRFEAYWNDGGYYSRDQCALLRAIKASLNRTYGMDVNLRSIYIPQLDLPYPAPETREVTIFEQGGFQPLRPNIGGTLNTIISSLGDQPVMARLYDQDGVMIGEGKQLGEESAGKTVPQGQTPQSMLKVGGLAANSFYMLQIVPGFALGSSGQRDITVGLTQQAAGQ